MLLRRWRERNGGKPITLKLGVDSSTGDRVLNLLFFSLIIGISMLSSSSVPECGSGDGSSKLWFRVMLTEGGKWALAMSSELVLD